MTVEYCLAAEFDIDKGSSLSFQYPPNSITENPSVLAELMLPEGSHLHDSDFTIFILNRKSVLNSDQYRGYVVCDLKNRHLIIMGAVFTIGANGEWEPIMKGEHTIEIIGSKLITSEDGQNKTTWTIANEHLTWTNNTVVYFPNLSLAIRFETVDDRVFFTEFLGEVCGTQYTPASIPTKLLNLSENYHVTPPVLYVLNMVATRQIEGVRRGARVKSIAIACKRPWVHVFRPVLLLALDQFFQNPCIEVLEAVYTSIRSLDLHHIPLLTFSEKKTFRSFIRNKVAHFDGIFSSTLPKFKYFWRDSKPLSIMDLPLEYEVPVRFDSVPLPLKIPSVTFDSEIGDFSVSTLVSLLSMVQITNPSSTKVKNGAPFSWHPHLDIGPNTSPVIILLYALLCEKRIVFVGHQKPCKEIANCVLASIAIASGGDLIPGVSDRCFPYASLANIDNLLKVNGFVAGVSNPVFEEQQAWWDICINIATLKMTISNSLTKAVVSEVKETNADQTIICEEDEILVQEVVDGIKRHLDEQHIRMLMYRYIERFVDMANRFPPESNIRDLNPSWANRVEGWLQTAAHKSLSQGGARVRQSLFGDKDIHGMIHQISFIPELRTDVIVKIFNCMDEMIQSASDHKLLEILASLQHTEGSCAPFSYGLFHERMEVRMAAARIILYLFAQKVFCINKLGPYYINPFVKTALLNLLTTDRRGFVRIVDVAIPERTISPPLLSVQTTKTPFSATNVFMPNVEPPSPLVPDSVISKILSTQSQNQLQMQQEITKSLSGMNVSNEDVASPISPTDAFLDLYDYSK